MEMGPQSIAPLVRTPTPRHAGADSTTDPQNSSPLPLGWRFLAFLFALAGFGSACGGQGPEKCGEPP